MTPDPRPEPDAVTLTEAERSRILGAFRDEAGSVLPDAILRNVERIVAARVADVEAERDVHRARADVLRANLSGTVSLRGRKPGDYWAEWHRDHCAAAQVAADAEARGAQRVVEAVESLADEWMDLEAEARNHGLEGRMTYVRAGCALRAALAPFRQEADRD